MFIKHSIFTICLAVLTGILYYSSRDFVYPSTVYINSLLAILALLTVLHAIKCIREYHQVDDTQKLSGRAKLKLTMGLLSAVLYGCLLPYVGFYASSFIYFFCCVHFFNPNRSAKSMMIALASATVGIILLYLLFSIGLKVPTPSGFLI